MNAEIPYVAGCPVCEASRQIEEGEGGAEAVRRPCPVALLAALDRLDVAADGLIREMEQWCPTLIITDTVESVSRLHDRLVEMVWRDDDAERLARFNELIGAASATLEAIEARHPIVARSATRTAGALLTVVALYRPFLAPAEAPQDSGCPNCTTVCTCNAV